MAGARLTLGILVAISVGCGLGPSPPEENFPRCFSRCGSILFRSYDCRGFQRTEDAFIAAASRTVGWAPDDTCKRLRTKVWVRAEGVGATDDGTWLSMNPQTGETQLVAGLSFCPDTILLGSDFWPLNAYAHEHLHIFEGCSNPGHVGWAENGYNQIILESIPPETP